MDVAGLVRGVRRRQRTGSLVVGGLLLFLSGWQAGRVMSPYYAAHPIVFNEAPNATAPAEADLTALRDAGLNTPMPLPSAPGQAAVAAAATQAPPGQSSGQFVGSVNSNKYHYVAGCPTWKQIKPANQIWFDTREEAEAAGYVPTACTKEKLNI